MVLKDHPSIIVSSLLVAVAGLFWSIGSSMRSDRIAELETKIEIYKASEDLGFKELLSSLRGASDELKSNLQIMAELSTLRKENVSYASINKELASEIEKLEQSSNEAISTFTKEKRFLIEQLASKEAELASLFLTNEKFTLTPGQTKVFGKYGLTLGYVDYASIREINVVFNNEKKRISPGNILFALVDGKKCQLILERYVFGDQGNSATFTFVVMK